MVVKQWMYREYRIDLQLIGADFMPYIYEPGNSEKLSYTPVCRNETRTANGRAGSRSIY
jgi:hypothetical protein